MILQTLKSIGALLAGLIVGMLAIGTLEMAGHLIYPPPPGLDPHSPDFFERVMKEIPLGALVLVLLAYAIGVTAACAISARLAPAAPRIHGAIVGACFLLAGIATMAMIPHPLWFVLAAIGLYPAAAAIGCLLGEIRAEPPPDKPLE